MQTLEENKIRVSRVIFVLVSILSAYFAIKIYSEIKKDSMLGESATPATISFSGHGEVTAQPDIANISFTISKDAATAAAAQAAVAAVEKTALDFLKTKNVDDKDIQTSNASVYPKYDNLPYVYTACPLVGGAPGATYDCGRSKQVQNGYTASESITVKVRNTDNVGLIMQGLGIAGVSDLNGPNFAIDNPDAVQAQARKLAIDDAKAKAEALAKDLGVSLGKITNFSESGANNYPIMAMSAAKAGSAAPAPAEIPKGENTITSDVTITYEIK